MRKGRMKIYVSCQKITLYQRLHKARNYILNIPENVGDIIVHEAWTHLLILVNISLINFLLLVNIKLKEC